MIVNASTRFPVYFFYMLMCLESALERGDASRMFEPGKSSKFVLRSPLLAALLIGLTIGLDGSRLGAETLHGVDFEVMYRPTAMPEKSDPAWRKTGALRGEVVPSSESPFLQLRSSLEGVAYYELKDGEWWRAGTALADGGVTVEFSVRVEDEEEAAEGVMGVSLADSQSAFVLLLDKNGIWPHAQPNAKVAVPLSEGFHTVRIVLPPGAAAASVYLDQQTEPALRLKRRKNASGKSRIAWGDLSARMGGRSSWQYFAFTNRGAFAP